MGRKRTNQIHQAGRDTKPQTDGHMRVYACSEKWQEKHRNTKFAEMEGATHDSFRASEVPESIEERRRPRGSLNDT
jgi:hypothetical protein